MSSGKKLSPLASMRTESRIDLRAAAGWNRILPPSDTRYGGAMPTVCRQHGFEPATSHESGRSADARPTVRAVTEVVQDVISDHR